MSNDYKNHILMLKQPKFVPAEHCWHWRPQRPEPKPLIAVIRKDYPSLYLGIQAAAFAGTMLSIWLLIIVLYI